MGKWKEKVAEESAKYNRRATLSNPDGSFKDNCWWLKGKKKKKKKKT